MKPFFDMTYELLRERNGSGGTQAGVRNLSRIFAETQEARFVDWAHLSEGGNGYIAERIAADAMEVLKQGRSAVAER